MPSFMDMDFLSMTDAEIDREDVRRYGLKRFTELAWPILEPSTPFIGNWHLDVMAEHLEAVWKCEINDLLINMPPRHALRLGTLIPTMRGLVPIERVKVGDRVFGPDGQPTRVLCKSPIFPQRRIYRVWTDDQAYLDVDGEHIWTVRLDRKRRLYRDYTTAELFARQSGAYVRRLRSGGVEVRGGKLCVDIRLPRLPDCAPAQYPEADLPLDPYVLGVWLGDGHCGHGVVTMADADAAIVREEIERRGVKTSKQNARYRFGLLGIRRALKAAGVMDRKHIPDQYMVASVQQRRDLLNGLMDTDGNVSVSGQCFFSQSDEAFARQVAQLVRSLGIKASLTSRPAYLNGKRHKDAWQVSFYASEIAVLPRKEERTLRGKREFGRYIRIEDLGEVDSTQCLSVERKDGLFQAGDGYIVTHNCKSIQVAVMFPAFVWTQEPSLRWLYSSYAQSLSIRDSVKMRRLIESPWYRERWGHVFELTSDQNQKLKFENNRSGYRMATSVGGSNTGEGGDVIVCLPYSSLIMTDRGLIPIGSIVEERLPVTVLSYDHQRGSSFEEIEAYEDNPSKPCIELTFSNGISLEGTEDHPVYIVGRGYLQLSQVPLGARVVAHRETVHRLRKASVSASQAYGASEERVLQPCLSRQMGERQEQSAMDGWTRRIDVPAVLNTVLGHAEPSQEGREILFDALSWLVPQGSSTSTVDDALLTLWNYDSDHKAQYRQAEVLLSSMRQSRASRPYRRGVKSSLRAWAFERALFGRLQSDGTEDSRAGRSIVSALSDDQMGDRQRIGCASHQLQQRRSQRDESDHTLSYLPWSHARWREKSEEMECSIVVARRRIAQPERVYNLRITNNHNYFANGILVHNCDDPHNVEQRESDVMREGAIDWWSNVMSTRVNNPKKRRRIVVGQRVHEHDLSGHLLDQGGWTHLNLPAEYEGGKCIVTGCVFHWDKDPRTTDGEPLWKDRYGAHEIQQLKKDLKEYGSAAQLQQRPAPAEGGILKRHWWKYWCYPGQEETLPPVRMKLPDGTYQEIKPIPLPYVFDRGAQGWDMAFKDLTTSSYVVGQQWGRKGPDAFLKDQVRDQIDFTATLEVVRSFNRTHRLPSEKVVEDKANGPAILSVLSKEIPGMMPHGVQGDKQARAAAYAHLVKAGNCYLPHPSIAVWVEKFVHECATFPNGEHDDQVDTWSMCMDVLYKVEDPGHAITPQYSAKFHQSSKGLEPVPGWPCFRFWYQGVYPCCIVGQIHRDATIILVDCVIGEQSSTVEQLIDRKVIPLLASDYRGCTEWRDVTNHGLLSAKSDPTEHHLDHIISAKLDGSAEPGEPDFFVRLNAIVGLLSQTGRLVVNSAPTPGEAKPWIHEALNGGYAYRKDANGVISKSEPRKFHPLTSVGEALGHGLARVFQRKPLPPRKFDRHEAQKRAKQYAV